MKTIDGLMMGDPHLRSAIHMLRQSLRRWFERMRVVGGRIPKAVRVGGLCLAVLLLGFVAWALHVDPAAEAGTPFSEQPNSPPDVIVVLVHGTFAPDAGWVFPTSPLVRSIRHSLEPQVVLFQPFIWSGLLGTRYNNTNLLRSAAGEKLGELLVVLRNRWPSAKIVLVAHSHGGNVALYAANRYGDSTRLSGIVCMGTPFIAATAKPIDDDPPMLFTLKIIGELLFAAMLIASVLLGVGGFRLAFGVGRLGKGVVRAVTLPGAVVIGVISFCLIQWPVSVDKDHPTRQEYVAATDTQPAHEETTTNYVESEAAKQLETGTKAWLIDTSLNWGKDEQAKLVARLSAITPQAVPIFCLRSQKDEAYRGLHGEDAISVGSTDFLSSSAVSSFVVLGGAALIACATLLVAIKTSIQYLRDDGLGFGNFFVALLLGAMMGWVTAIASCVAFGAMLVLLAPLAVLARAPAAAPAMIAYGSLDLSSEYLIDTQSLPEPVGWTAGHVAGSELKTYVFPESLRGLEHSKYYEDPDSVRDISLWIKERVISKVEGSAVPAVPQ